MSRAHTLLVIDWDTFFDDALEGGTYNKTDRAPLLFDWSKGESPLYQEMLWPGRAAVFLSYRFALPGLTGQQIGFWDRFTGHIAPRAKLFYADSNALAASRKIVTQRSRFDDVWLFDAHHDAGYVKERERGHAVGKLIRGGSWDCGNWSVLYWVIGARLHARYPTWKTRVFDLEVEPIVPVDRQFDDGTLPLDVSFDRIFVCRSSGWVPPWNNHDQQFLDFVEAAPVTSKTCLQSVTPRAFDMAQVQAEAAQMRVWRSLREAQLGLAAS